MDEDGYPIPDSGTMFDPLYADPLQIIRIYNRHSQFKVVFFPDIYDDMPEEEYQLRKLLRDFEQFEYKAPYYPF